MKTFRIYFPILIIISTLLVFINLDPQRISVINNQVSCPAIEKDSACEETLKKAETTNDKLPISFKYFPYPNFSIRVGFENSISELKSNSYVVTVPERINGSEKIWLEYDLFGMEDFTCIPHSVNDNLATGGYWKAERNQWTHQKEQISANSIRQGQNIIRFTKPLNRDFKYIIKNLKIQIDKQIQTHRELVINQPSTAYYFKKFGIVQGFVQGYQSDKAVVTIDGKNIPTIKGTFEHLIQKPENSLQTWSSEIIAKFPDGEVLTSSISFDHPIDCEILTQDNNSINFTEEVVDRSGEFTATLNGMHLQARMGASTPGKKISILGLRNIDFPTMDAGMVNVTEKEGGYRCLPHGTKFQNDVLVTLNYDPSLLPEGYNPQDIYTFFYDENLGQWTPLQRDTVDLANNAIISRTNHFTDFINGIIKVPESPLTQAYTPTSIKDIKAANPLESMGVFQPPTANNTGSAKLSYPLVIPQGRRGMQPQLTLQYTSGGENGWLGMGWSISIPAINVETRWGVPQYNSVYQSETYCINGEQVTTKDQQGFYEKLPHRGKWKNRKNGDIQYYPRVEGAFDSIIRHGNSPKEYWWEVTDRNGTKSYYGKKFDKDQVDSSAILFDDHGNIAYWALTLTLDPFKNFVRYYYEKVSDVGVSGGSYYGQQLYVSRINYTGWDFDKGKYDVFFERWDKQIYQRNDVTISGRYGFKEVTADLLRKIIITYENKPIRKYFFGYKEGEFAKTLLCGVLEAEAEDTVQAFENEITDPAHACKYLEDRLYTKTQVFEYYNDYNSKLPNFQPFGQEYTLDSHTDNLDDMGASSAISASKSGQWGVNGALTLGIGANPFLKNATVGGSYNYNATKSKDLNVSLMDINGDGLPDKVWSKDGHIHFRKQYYNPSGNNYLFGNDTTLLGPSTFLYQESSSDGWGGQASFYSLSGSYQRSISTSTTSIYFSDVNGDGFPDIINDDQVYFNHLDINGNPSFEPESTDTVYIATSSCQYTIHSGSVDDSVTICNNTDPFMTSGVSKAYDAVRMWVAPYEGHIYINAPIKLMEDTSEARRMSRHADGIRFTIQKNSSELYHDTIAADDYTEKVPSSSSLLNIEVKAGDSLFFRLQSRNTRSFDIVKWDPEIYYLNVSPETDPNGKQNFIFKASEDFILEEDRCIGAPVAGLMKLIGSIGSQTPLSDTVVFKVFHNTSLVHNQVFPCGVPFSYNFDNNINVAQNDSFAFQLRSSSNIDWSAVDFNSHFYYLSNTAGIPDTNEDGSRNIEFYPVLHKTIYNKPIFITSPHVIQNSSVTVRPYLKFQSNTIDGSVVFSIKSNNTVLQKRYITIQNGQIFNVPSIPVTLSPPQTVFFEFSTIDTTLMFEVLDAKAVIVGGDSLEAGLNTLYPKELLKFGALYRGWGQFTYNNLNADYDDPINTSLLVYNQTMYNHDSITSNPDTSSLANFLSSFSSFYNPDNCAFIMMQPFANKGAYVGFGELTTISDTIVRHCRLLPDTLTLDDPIPIALDPNKPVKTVRKQTISANDSYGFGAGPLNINKTDGTNELAMDYFDINGDRYPDIIGPEFAQISSPQGGLSSLLVPHYQANGKRSNLSSYTSVGATFGTSFLKTEKVPSPNVKNAKFTTSGQMSLSVGDNDDGTNYTWQDVNGDGLSDKVKDNGSVCLNLGYKFLPAETWNFNEIRSGHSRNIGLNGGVNYNICNLSFSGGLGMNASDNNSKEVLQDINGDGIVDRMYFDDDDLKVLFNTGNQLLSTPVPFNPDDISYGVSHSRSLNIGVTFGFVIPIPFVPIKICINPGYSTGTSFNTEKVQLTDMDADGYPDYVKSESEDVIKVRYSNIRRTNLLKSVDNYLGGHFIMDYALSRNSVDMAQRTWTMSSLKVYDGFAEDGPDFTYYTFSYDSGYYSRYERQSYGFKTVTTKVHDSTSSSNVYKSTIEKYHNNSFVFKNLKYYDLLTNGNGVKYIESTYLYYLKEIATGDTIPMANPECYGEGFPAIQQEDKFYYEGTGSVQIHTVKRYDHGSYGNIRTYYDDGDITDNNDDVYGEVTYHPDSYGRHIVSVPSSIQVKHNSTLFRHRETEIDYSTGSILQIRMLNGAQVAVYDMGYYPEGNLERLTYPENLNSQRMTYKYEYDQDVKTYVANISDNLGYSFSSIYDPRFGKVLKTNDIAGQEVSYQYDHRGRLTKIVGPKESIQSLPYTLKFKYWDEYGCRKRVQRTDTIPWARTYHYDPYHPADDIKTTLFADAQGKILQTKKDIVVYDSATNSSTQMMTVSGRVYYDEYGRTIKTYYPVTENLGSDSIFKFPHDNISPSRTTFDILDRVTTQVKPDGITTLVSYSCENDPDNIKRFLTTTTDAKGIQTKVYKDPSDKQTAVHASYNSWTIFSYDPIGQLIASVDPEGNITKYVYDKLGRKTSRQHPDAGTTNYEFDPVGNITRLQTANLNGISSYIYYYYEFKNLVRISYPENPENNVQYEYGLPNTGNQSGRLIKQEDVNGIQTFTYDELGNVQMNIKTMIVPYDSIYTFGTYTAYDTWNRIDSIVYPDGEVVKYWYNEGGLLKQMNGLKGSASFQYVDNIGYDKFESRNYLRYGNGTKTYYTYDPYRRNLKRLQSISSNNHNMMVNIYSYDSVDNITRIASNTTPNSNNIGGSIVNIYAYDSLYRLNHSSGTSVVTNGTYEFDLDMIYYLSGKIRNKDQSATLGGNTIPQLTYNSTYIYQGTQPHAPSTIGNEDLIYDHNGNLLRSINTGTGTKRYHSWDEENRMKLVTDQQKMGYYLYDGGGERTLKIIGKYSSMNISGEAAWKGYLSNKQTLYVNPYLVVNNKEYTKHYYIENQRIVSKLGGGFLMDTVPLFHLMYGFHVLDPHAYNIKKHEDEAMVKRDLMGCGQPGTLQMTVGLFNFLSHQPSRNDPEENIFYYHGDHLGSTSYITDVTGMPSQHVDYLPFGEPLLEEKTQTWQSPYKFNCKEQDEESGLNYYGARYLDSKWGMWLGVDPMADKYPGLSPFAYCANNPLRLVDPNGKEIVYAGDEEKTAYNNYRTMIFSDKKYSHIQKELTKMEKADEKFRIRMNDNISTDDGGGNFTYNKENKEFDVNIAKGGDFTSNEKMSHELKHVDQYLNGKIGFDLKGSGKFGIPMAYDRQDEYEAYDRQGEFGNTLSQDKIDSQYSKLDYYKTNYEIRDIKVPTIDNMQKVNNKLLELGKNPRFLFH